MRTFPALVKLKLKMSQLVGEEEVSLAQQAQLTQIVYIQLPDQNDATNPTVRTNSNANATDQNILAIDASSSNVSPS